MSSKLSGDRCRCSACQLTFTSTSAFDDHRRGPYTDRRCLTADELTAKGFAPNGYGHWRRPATAEQIAKFNSAQSTMQTPRTMGSGPIALHSGHERALLSDRRT